MTAHQTDLCPTSGQYASSWPVEKRTDGVEIHYVTITRCPGCGRTWRGQKERYPAHGVQQAMPL